MDSNVELTAKRREELCKRYEDEIHLIGRIGLTVGMGLLLAVPFVFARLLNTEIMWEGFFAGLLQTVPVYLPSCIAEFLVYVPMLGAGASYLAFITGNLVNLKIPCVVNARDICKTKVSTVENDIVSTLSVATSALVNTLVLALGVALLVPLTPVLENPVLIPGFNQVIPALFGALAYKYFRQSIKVTAVPLVLMCALCVALPSLIGSVAFLMLGSGALAIGIAYMLWRRDRL